MYTRITYCQILNNKSTYSHLKFRKSITILIYLEGKYHPLYNTIKLENYSILNKVRAKLFNYSKLDYDAAKSR